VVRVGLVGLGVIGAVHLDVLAALPGVSVAFVVDPRPAPAAHAHGVAQFPTLAAALASQQLPDVVVVATPTDTHLDLVEQALRGTDGLVVSEKPLTRDTGRLRRFEAEHRDDLARLRVVNHFAYSPEVEWAVRMVRRHGWGAPRRVFADFNGPYAAKSPAQRASYVSPWVDSGSNQVSMLCRLCRGWVVRAQQTDDDGLRVVTELDFQGGRATLVANWWTGDSSKQTCLRWPGDTEIHLDHTAMTGYAVVDGTVTDHLGHDGTVGRKTAHYTAMYRALLAGTDDDLLGVGLARDVAELLGSARAATRSPGTVAWTLGRLT
jgi:predicted dehydrogenase